MTAHNGNPADSPKPVQYSQPGCYVWTPHTHYGPSVTVVQPGATSPTPEQTSQAVANLAAALMIAEAERDSARAAIANLVRMLAADPREAIPRLDITTALFTPPLPNPTVPGGAP